MVKTTVEHGRSQRQTARTTNQLNLRPTLHKTQHCLKNPSHEGYQPYTLNTRYVHKMTTILPTDSPIPSTAGYSSPEPDRSCLLKPNNSEKISDDGQTSEISNSTSVLEAQIREQRAIVKLAALERQLAEVQADDGASERSRGSRRSNWKKSFPSSSTKPQLPSLKIPENHAEPNILDLDEFLENVHNEEQAKKLDDQFFKDESADLLDITDQPSDPPSNEIILPTVEPIATKRLAAASTDKASPPRKASRAIPEEFRMDRADTEGFPAAPEKAPATTSETDDLREALAHRDIELQIFYASQQQTALVSYQA